MIAFIVFIIILIVIYKITSPISPIGSKIQTPEGFFIPPPPPAVSLNNGVGAVPSELPGSLVGGPYQQVQRSDPTLYHIKGASQASFESIASLFENIKGFLSFEAQEIEDVSDPTVKLPLQTARADFERLKEEVHTMQRNHGLPSSISEIQIEEMSSNLAYLQRNTRAVEANKPLNNTVLEGFYSDDRSQENIGEIATEEDLKQFISKLEIEIVRLSGSAAEKKVSTNEYSKFSITDSDSVFNPLIKVRVENLGKIKHDIEEIIKGLKNGFIEPSQIPVFKKDLERALPLLGKINDPLPSLIQTFNLPPALANLLPSSLKNDRTTINKISSLLDKYAKDIVNGTSVSATFNVKYEQPAPSGAGCMTGLLLTGIPSKHDIDRVSNSTTCKLLNQGNVTDNFALDPRFDGRKQENIAKLTGNTDDGFGWKERVLSIREQVRKRGYNPTDFGFLKPDDIKNTSSGFSWKGYAHVMCSRLAASYESGLPELCGCPPENWKGW